MYNATQPPLISVIVPTYNSAACLRDTLRSLLLQTYSTWECIVWNDGSTDNTETVALSFADPRIQYHGTRENRGRGFARHSALSCCSGEYLAMVDAGDLFFPNKLETQVQFLGSHSQCVAVSSPLVALLEGSRALGVLGRVQGHGSTAAFQTFSPSRSPRVPVLPFAPSLVRMDVAQQVTFDPSFRRAEDMDFLLGVESLGPVSVLRDSTYVYSWERMPSYSYYAGAYPDVLRVLEKHRLLQGRQFNRLGWITRAKWIWRAAEHLAGKRRLPPLSPLSAGEQIALTGLMKGLGRQDVVIEGM